MSTLSEQKAAIRRVERVERRARRRQFWREARCYWTWPIGHAYSKETGKCVGCDSYPRINL